MTTLIISDTMDDIMKIVKSLQESGLLIKGVSETIQNELGALAANFMGKYAGRQT